MDYPDLRKIIHVDMDAFYASVEQRDRPEIRGRPVVVGGDPQGRGVVASASYEARRYGIRSAISCRKAFQLCPDAVFLYPNFEKYREVSDRIHEIFESVTSSVEPLSLDEAYLDVTENRLGEPLAGKLALHIKQEIRARVGLTASAGVGPNKFVAKVASDFKKPDGLVVVPPERVREFVEKLPVEKLWGVGPATAKKLHALGLRTAKDVRDCDLEILLRELGSYADFLYGLCHGVDPRPVESDSLPKSRGSETTFEKDILDIEVLKEAIREQASEVAESLRELGYLARTLTLKLRYHDFKTISRSRTLFRPSDSADTIAWTASNLMLESTEAGVVPVRLVGVSASGLLHREDPQQLWLDLPLIEFSRPS